MELQSISQIIEPEDDDSSEMQRIVQPQPLRNVKSESLWQKLTGGFTLPQNFSQAIHQNIQSHPDEIIYLDIELVIEIHELMVARSGGLLGIKDLSLVESAVFNPEYPYYENIYEKAAILLYSLANNHGFVDGNKRTALFSTLVFLSLNGYAFNCADNISGRMMEYLVKHHKNKDVYEAWIRKHAAQQEKHREIGFGVGLLLLVLSRLRAAKIIS